MMKSLIGILMEKNIRGVIFFMLRDVKIFIEEALEFAEEDVGLKTSVWFDTAKDFGFSSVEALEEEVKLHYSQGYEDCLSDLLEFVELLLEDGE
jgi:hypothetical protein